MSETEYIVLEPPLPHPHARLLWSSPDSHRLLSFLQVPLRGRIRRLSGQPAVYLAPSPSPGGHHSPSVAEGGFWVESTQHRGGQRLLFLWRHFTTH
jgi:hypothetical protein